MTCTQMGETNNNLEKHAAILVDTYNKQAGALASTVQLLLTLKKQMNDAEGNIIVSGDGWNNNALTKIPMLRMRDQQFPAIKPLGQFHNADPFTGNMHYDAKSSFSEADTAASTLIRKAQDYQFSAKQQGRHISISEAVSFVKSDMGGSFSDADTMMSILARKAQDFQYSEKQKGREISITDAVHFVKSQNR